MEGNPPYSIGLINKFYEASGYMEVLELYPRKSS
jgi:hypothetical protein